MTSAAPFLFETERLGARRWTDEEAKALFAIYGDPEVTTYMRELHQQTLDEQIAHIPRLLGTYEAYGPGFGAFAIVEKATGQAIGTILLKTLPDAQGVSTDRHEVGWHLARSRWRRGYGAEIAKGAFQYARAQLGVTTLHAVVRPGNVASMALALRVGMTSLGETQQYYDGELLQLYATTLN